MIRYRLRQSLARTLVAHLRRDFGPECTSVEPRCATCQAYKAARILNYLYDL